jgi:hypothetical protein
VRAAAELGGYGGETSVANKGGAMRNAILVMLLAVVSCDELAGPLRWPKWVAVGESVDSWVYADVNSIRKKGDMVKIWDLQDYKRAIVSDRLLVLSLREQLEFDCKEERVRTLFKSVFGMSMAEGKELKSEGDGTSGAWSPVSPLPIQRGLLRFACKK